jgi:penicillin-binding protein-related factor A (putative recombinase)
MRKRPTLTELQKVSACSRSEKTPAARQTTNLGRALERALDAQHSVYTTQRRGVMVRQYPATIYQSGGGIIHGRAVVDYLGFVDGAPVALEAKRCVSGRFVFRDGDKLPQHQIEFLEWWTMCNGIALFITCFDASVRGDCVLISAVEVIRALRAGDRSWNEDVALSYGFACRGPDWAAHLGRFR